MPVTAPDWLAKHEGNVMPNNTGDFWLVVFEGEPQYRLTPIPAGGKHGCDVAQTINGRRIECKSIFETREAAVQGGLEALRQALGW